MFSMNEMMFAGYRSWKLSPLSFENEFRAWANVEHNVEANNRNWWHSVVLPVGERQRIVCV